MNLTLFDKVNIAHCAIQRANANVLDRPRFIGEYDTVRCWRQHQVNFVTTADGQALNFQEK